MSSSLDLVSGMIGKLNVVTRGLTVRDHRPKSPVQIKSRRRWLITGVPWAVLREGRATQLRQRAPLIGVCMLKWSIAGSLVMLSLMEDVLAIEPPICPWHAAGNTMDKPIPAGHPALKTRPSTMVAGVNCTATDFANDYKSTLTDGPAGTPTVAMAIDNGWSFSFWQATTSDPMVTVNPRSGATWTYAISQGWNKLRIPKSAYPAGWDVPVSTYRDRHMVVYEPSGTYLTEFFGMVRTETSSGPTWAAKAIRRYMKTEKGYQEVKDKKGGTRLCQMSLAHGIIRYDELTKGTHEIKHALTFSYPAPASNRVTTVKNSMFPCLWNTTFSHPVAEANPRKCLMPLGIRLQFNPAADAVHECRLVESKYRNSCISIVRAMQKYGMVLVDGGSGAIYAEDRSKKTQKWSDYASTGYALPLNGKRVLNGVNFRDNIRAIEPVL